MCAFIFIFLIGLPSFTVLIVMHTQPQSEEVNGTFLCFCICVFACMKGLLHQTPAQSEEQLSDSRALCLIEAWVEQNFTSKLQIINSVKASQELGAVISTTEQKGRCFERML